MVMAESKEKCLNCSQNKNCRDSSASWIFFIIGIIATIAVRVVTVLMHLNPVYGKLAWYIGVGGFVIFFIYKFNVLQSRNRFIVQNNLLNKVASKTQLKDEDYRALEAMLCSLTSRKEKINYFFIFILSAVALAIALYIDFFR
ncbi:MAG: hypothetical protein JW734_10035 [Candidatus Omnitrophica bacterium]|nr:hypothetical protein [Candidatus Omnitrophota bacterium]